MAMNGVQESPRRMSFSASTSILGASCFSTFCNQPTDNLKRSVTGATAKMGGVMVFETSFLGIQTLHPLSIRGFALRRVEFEHRLSSIGTRMLSSHNSKAIWADVPASPGYHVTVIAEPIGCLAAWALLRRIRRKAFPSTAAPGNVRDQ